MRAAVARVLVIAGVSSGVGKTTITPGSAPGLAETFVAACAS